MTIAFMTPIGCLQLVRDGTELLDMIPFGPLDDPYMGFVKSVEDKEDRILVTLEPQLFHHHLNLDPHPVSEKFRKKDIYYSKFPVHTVIKNFRCGKRAESVELYEAVVCFNKGQKNIKVEKGHHIVAVALADENQDNIPLIVSATMAPYKEGKPVEPIENNYVLYSNGHIKFEKMMLLPDEVKKQIHFSDKKYMQSCGCKVCESYKPE